MNVPNAISMARLISGPFVAYLILDEHWAAALGLLAVAGASDWADGYAAKHYGQSSVLGSYLDPLADKVLVCCTVGALAQQVSTCLLTALQASSDGSSGMQHHIMHEILYACKYELHATGLFAIC